MITKAAVVRRPGVPVAIETLALADPRGDEVLVRLVACGISHADLESIADPNAPFPFVPGGAGAGLIEGVGSAVTSLAAGDAVVLLRGSWPRRDRSHPFDAGDVAAVAASALATHCLCRAEDLHRVEGDAPLELFAGLDEEMRAAVAAVVSHNRGDVGGAVVVAGAGAAGLAAIMAGQALGINPIIAVDPDERRRHLATDLGASLTVHTDEDIGAVVRSFTGVGAGFILDTTGHAGTIEACVQALAPGGSCSSLRGPSHRHVSMDDGDAVVAAVAVWHAQGRFPIETLIAFFPFEHVNDALAALADNSVVKPVVRFSLGPFATLDRAGSAGAAVEARDDAETNPVEAERSRVSAPVPEPG